MMTRFQEEAGFKQVGFVNKIEQLPHSIKPALADDYYLQDSSALIV
jgi:hypothetical protein